MKIHKEKAELLAAKVASSGATIGCAAEELGMNKNHAYQITRTPEYRQAIAQRTLELADAITTQTIELHGEALAVLRELMKPIHAPEIRLNAAKAILVNFSRIHETASKQIVDANAAIKQNETNTRIEHSLLNFPVLPNASRN
jgi:hypothetical protein